MNVTVYVNGKRVTKEELSKIEIHNDNIKRIFSEHLGRKKNVKEECVNRQRDFV